VHIIFQFLYVYCSKKYDDSFIAYLIKMLVSHSHKFILVKTKKTAGSSIQSFLKPYCKKGIVEEIFGSHRGAESIIELVGEDIWNSYLKICPVRNPWDLMVSFYFWERRQSSILDKLKRLLEGKHMINVARRISFTDYILLREEVKRSNINRSKMLVNGNWPSYFFVRYEYLMEDMSELCESLNIPFREEKFPNKKGGFREGKGYREFYNEETKKIVSKAYAEEISKFEYNF